MTSFYGAFLDVFFLVLLTPSTVCHTVTVSCIKFVQSLIPVVWGYVGWYFVHCKGAVPCRQGHLFVVINTFIIIDHVQVAFSVLFIGNMEYVLELGLWQ